MLLLHLFVYMRPPNGPDLTTAGHAGDMTSHDRPSMNSDGPRNVDYSSIHVVDAGQGSKDVCSPC